MSGRGSIIAVGHVGIAARDLDGLASFYRDLLGLKLAVHHPGIVAIFEVGDADFFLLPGESSPVGFDLAADDVDALRERLVSKGVACDVLKDDKRSGHRGFEFTDPEGNRVQVVNAHPRARA